MSLIKKPSELNVQAKIKMLIYGQAGTGKSTLSLSAPRPLLFDFDNGINRVNFEHIKSTVQIENYTDMLEVINKEDLSDFDTLIIDTGGKCLDSMANYIISRNSKMGKSNGTLTLQGYGERKAEFTALCKLIASKNKHVIFVAHRETKQDGDDTRYIPLFGGSNYDSLVTELDLVGYMEANGRKRIITFDPTSRNDGKNTCNLPSTMEIPTIVNEKGIVTGQNNFIEEHVIKPYIARLADRIKLTEMYNNVVSEIKDQIELITDSAGANDFVSRIDSFEHVGSSKSMAAQLLADKTKKIGLKFNKETKLYE